MFTYFYNWISKVLTIGKKSYGGRNFFGRICVFGRGGGLKRRYRVIDLIRRINLYGMLISILKDCNRTAMLGIFLYSNGLITYNILCEPYEINMKIFSGFKQLKFYQFPIKINWSIPMKFINLFTCISNIELYFLKGAKYVRSAGTSCLLISRVANKVTVKLPSGWLITIPENNFATIGIVSNSDHKFSILKLAGQNRKLGFRPKVRGVAKNPCDHPHGGGNGKKSPPVNAVTPWGLFTKKTPTVNTKEMRLKRRLYKKI